MKRYFLNEARQEIIRAAFTRWLEGQENKTTALKKIGGGLQRGWAWKTGLRPVPPPQLIKIWAKTRDNGLLWTSEEKVRYKERTGKQLPNDDSWPDLDQPNNQQPAETLPQPEMKKKTPTNKPVGVFSDERALVLQDAFADWYNGQAHKANAMNELGHAPQTGSDSAAGRIVVPFAMIYKLWQKTGNTVWLLTAEEKARYRRFGYETRKNFPLPSEENWPNLDSNGRSLVTVKAPKPVQQSGTPLHKMEKAATLQTDPQDVIDRAKFLLTELGGLIKNINKLPPEHRLRKKAQRALVSATMQLFREAQELDLDYPEDFKDLLKQMDFATNILRPGK